MSPSSPRARSALITGGARGIGRAFALALAKPNTTLFLADCDVERAERTAEELRARGSTCEVITCDVTDPDSVERAAQRVERAVGAPDWLINNAGVLVTGTVADLELAEYQRVIDVNLWGVIHGCRAFAPRMRARRRGAIINVASLAGHLPIPLMGPYAATKAAVIALSENLRNELATSGVTVTVLCPSVTRTELIGAASGHGHEPSKSRAQRIMDLAGATADEVARCALTAAERGELYAVPTHHGKLAWRAKRLAPAATCKSLSALQRWV